MQPLYVADFQPTPLTRSSSVPQGCLLENSKSEGGCVDACAFVAFCLCALDCVCAYSM